MSLRLFHTADLHLTTRAPDRDYGLAVLDELVYHCRRLQADAWLLCGDIFDTPDDLEALAPEFTERLKDLDGLPVLMIPGNHELAGGRDPGGLAGTVAESLAPAVTLAHRTPFSLHRPDGLDMELLALPFRPGYAEFMDWPIPARERRWRVGLTHGTVNGMAYTGESGEDEHGIIDPHLFSRLELDYAALGHIHKRGEARFIESGWACLAHYPGSARVWRRGESGARRATLTVLDGGDDGAGIRTEPVEIEEAGQYRTLAIPLGDDGQPLEHADARALVTSLAERFGPRDWVRLELEGFIEARAPAEALQRALERAAEGRFRSFEVGLESLVEAERLRGHPLVRGFDAQWRRRHDQALADNDEQEAALLVRARQLALEAIRERLEAF
ncbi:MAG: metallophosphoesterase [bacterium]